MNVKDLYARGQNKRKIKSQHFERNGYFRAPKIGLKLKTKHVYFIQAALMITDGMQTTRVRGKTVEITPLPLASKKLKDKGVRVYSLGIGRPIRLSDQELNDVASKPRYVYKARSFRTLTPRIDDLVKSMCEGRKLL